MLQLAYVVVFSNLEVSYFSDPLNYYFDDPVPKFEYDDPVPSPS